jgi:hypothetical protein
MLSAASSNSSLRGFSPKIFCFCTSLSFNLFNYTFNLFLRTILKDLSSNKKVLLQQAPMESYNQHGGIFASLAYYLSTPLEVLALLLLSHIFSLPAGTHEVTIAEAQKKKNLREAAEVSSFRPFSANLLTSVIEGVRAVVSYS